MNETQIQTVLKHLSSQLHQFIDMIGEIPYVALPSERPEIICFSGKIKELTGYDVNEILADKEHWENMIHPYDHEQVFAAFTRCKSEGMPFNIEYRIVHRNGSLRFVSDNGEPVFNDKGETCLNICIAKEIQNVSLETFFILNNQLIFIKDKNELISYELQ